MAPTIDADHRGPLLVLAALITLIPMVLFVLAKVWTKWQVAKALHFDDAYMLLAMSIAIGQIINTAFQVKSGVGQHQIDIDIQQFQSFQKTTYISQIFYVTVMTFTKLATLQFLRTLARSAHYRIIAESIMVLVGAWFVAAVFCISFQCALPHPWNAAIGKCLNQEAFWTANAVVDVATQLVICAVPIYLLYKVRMNKHKKLIAMLSFTPNLTTIPLTILRLVYIYRSEHSPDLTWDTFNLALVSEIQINYNVMASCIPFMRPLFDSLAIGLVNMTILPPVNEDTTLSKIDEFGVYSRLNRLNPYAILSGRPRERRNVYYRNAISNKADSSTGEERTGTSVLSSAGPQEAGGASLAEIDSRMAPQEAGGVSLVEMDGRKNEYGSRSQEITFINEIRVTTVSSERINHFRTELPTS